MLPDSSKPVFDNPGTVQTALGPLVPIIRDCLSPFATPLYFLFVINIYNLTV